jgi:hypothetical protein
MNDDVQWYKQTRGAWPNAITASTATAAKILRAAKNNYFFMMDSST